MMLNSRISERNGIHDVHTNDTGAFAPLETGLPLAAAKSIESASAARGMWDLIDCIRLLHDYIFQCLVPS